MPVNPEEIPIGADTGAETQRRFRYQAVYLAVLALDLVRVDPELQAIWCEHGDDGMLQRVDGSYVAVQIKTKAVGQPAITANDDQARSAIRTFVDLEDEVGDSMASYVLASSIGFGSANQMSDLRHILRCVGADTDRTEVSAYVKRTSKAIERTEASVVAVLKKMRLEDSPSLEDAGHRLTLGVAELPEMADADVTTCRRLAEDIADRIQKASQLEHRSPRHDVIAFMSDPTAAHLAETAEGKRVSRADLASILNTRVSTPLLETQTVEATEELPPDSSRARKKMLAGGLPLPLVNNMVDLRGSYEAEMLRRAERYGLDRASKEATHVELLIATEGTAAHAAAPRKSGQAFGKQMYADLESRLGRRVQSPDGYAGVLRLTFEQLMGALTVVTDRCKVWWTDDIAFLATEGRKH